MFSNPSLRKGGSLLCFDPQSQGVDGGSVGWLCAHVGEAGSQMEFCGILALRLAQTGFDVGGWTQLVGG